jgi:hypothetical protein
VWYSEKHFFVKYITMLYQWQLVKNKVIQSNFPGDFHDKISLRISKERRSCGSNEGPVKFLSTQAFCPLKKVKFHWD